MSFHGTYSVMVTPYDAKGEVDVATLERYVDWQINEGIHGLIPLGSTGEFLSLSDAEQELVAKTVIDRAAKRVPVLIGTGAEDTREVVRLSRRAEKLGADGVMIIPPFYSTPTEDELFHHFKTVGEAVSLPIMIYNNPATANVDLRPEIVARLSEIDTVSYIKESTLEVTRIRDIQRLCGERMTVFGGILGFESFCEGAAGWVSVPSNIAPRVMSDIYRLVAEKGDLAGARELYRKHFRIIDFVAGHYYVAGAKATLSLMGLPVGLPRPPRLPLPEARMEMARKLVADFGLSVQGV
ncbi:4-hydroxy-tetrahydrodipicolinate synthase [Azorhizobium oxalatiphilum]|uniref:4-hydroxy-tetrahydrodipicolinate synthase n=1 Tax=Azorhizobium oxalatiphilum TaxID=980631 RepID=A0A917C3A0_9HYPH|nr:4-hydroxy-tetrahydrodipicolinate synthase [Azorhizobium oxalatiphilum]GGF70202.1 4-hydroxy-tetrahydrodipicolinate synthase [Azorhizobium oxalatiphilum]